MQKSPSKYEHRRKPSPWTTYRVRCDLPGGSSFTIHIDALSRADAITQVKREYDNITDVSIIRV